MPSTYSHRLPFAVVVILLITCAGPSPAQTIRDTLFEEVREKLEPLINDLQKIEIERPEEYNLFIVDAILSQKDEALEPINKDKLYDLKIKQLEQDWGLNLRAQANHNFESQFFNQDEFDDQQTPLRLRAGVDWEIMKDGLLAHQNKIQQLKNEKEAEWHRYDKQKNKERYFYRYNVLIYYFNKEKIALLRQRKQYLEEQLKLLYRIYYIRDIMFEDIINMKGELDQVEVQLKNYLDYNALMESTIGIKDFPEGIDVLQLPIVDLDVNRLISDSAHVLNDKRPELLELENDRLKNAPVNDISLRLQLYQNLGFADPNTPQRTYTSGGVVASVPLEFFYRGNLPEEIALEKSSVRGHRSKYMDLNAATEIVNYYYEFNYKLKQYVQFVYKYMLYEEKLRVEQVDKVHFTDYYQPFKILKYYDQIHLIKLEILDLKQQLYLFLLKIYSKTNLKSLKEYLIPISSTDYYAKLPATRTIFMNEQDFERYDLHFIGNYLRFNDFNFAILPAEATQVDLWDDQTNAKRKEIEDINFVKTIPWNRTYTNPSAYADLIVEEVEKEGYSGFMLKVLEEDVQNLNAENTGELINSISELFIEIQNRSTDQTIFLNLPISFPLKEATKLSGWTDKIILRMNSESDLDYVKTLTDRILPFEYLPICVSIDVDGFADRLKLEAYINQIIQDKRINDLVFNNFHAFVKMEARMFQD